MPEPYRTLARVEVIKKPTCGLINPNTVGGHACSPPGWLDRLFRVKYGALWRCGTCQRVWEFLDPKDHRTRNVSIGEWIVVSEKYWIEAGGAKE